MFELILIIIIFSVIKRAAKKKKETSSTVQAVRPQQNNVVQISAAQKKPANPQVANTQRVKVQSQPKENTTTEFLREKAMADDKAQMRDKQIQKMKNNKYYGGHNYAQKYIIGDPVPKDKRMVYCAYCNAENLIPAYSRAGGYNCYFCREEL